MPSDLILYSKSHAEIAWRCQREEYLAYLWGGTGIRTMEAQFELEFGSIIHESAHTIIDLLKTPIAGYSASKAARGLIEAKAPAFKWDATEAKQWGSIAAGLVHAYHTRILPGLLTEFEIVDVEVPMVYPIDPATGLWFVAKPDLILKRRQGGGLWYVEHKTTSKIDAAWLNSWTTAVQIHSGLMAAQRKYHQTFDGCIVLGWFKGTKDYYASSKDNKQIQNSPFAWGWVSRGAPGVFEDRYLAKRPDKWKGWEKFPTWTYGVEKWVDEQMSADVVLSQFARTPPITVRVDLVERYFNQLRFAAKRIVRAKQQLATATCVQDIDNTLDEFFPQSFSQCSPTWGRGKCWARDFCWQSWVQADPLASGLYVRNSGEHRAEFEKLIEADHAESR